jgi:hypothetical protein
MDELAVLVERTLSIDARLINSTPKNYDECKLIKLMKHQIKGDDYNNPLLWIYERIDDITKKININIDEPIYRNMLSLYLEDIYKPFDEYLMKNHQEAFIRHRNNRFSSDMEYHALHEYLKENNFTQENVIKFIEIDMNDRKTFKSFRDYAEIRYFDKYGSYQLKYSDYSNNIIKYKYDYL